MRIEFYLSDEAEVCHFAPVLRELLKMGVEATFVSVRRDPKWYNADRAKALIDALELPVATGPNPDADLAIATYTHDVLRDYRRLRARMMYGINLTFTFSVQPSIALWYSGFDLYLVHGPLIRRIATQYVRPEQVRTIGYPRFDGWFNNPGEAQVIRQKHKVTGSKPVILYLPTWQHRSSIDAFADSVFALSERFEILVKPHQCTFRMEPERMHKLNSGPVRMLAPTMPQEEAFALVDVVLTDLSSGALSDTIFLNKEAVGLGTKEELNNLLLPEVGRHIPICLAPEDLSQKVSEALALDLRSGEIQELRKELFDSTEGGDAARAARIICEFVEEKPRSRWSAVRRIWARPLQF